MDEFTFRADSVDDVVDCLWPIFAKDKETGDSPEGNAAESGGESTSQHANLLNVL